MNTVRHTLLYRSDATTLLSNYGGFTHLSSSFYEKSLIDSLFFPIS